MTPVTVQLVESDLPQAQLKLKLEAIVGELRREGITQSAKVEAVFPDDADRRRRALFVVRVKGGENEVVSGLNLAPEVEHAYVAPARGVLDR